MSGVLYVIGIGPGDPELITLKAMRILKETSVVCVPKGREEGGSLALSIAKKVVALDDKEVIEIHFPMKKTKRQTTEHRTQSTDKGKDTDSELYAKWDETADVILSKLNKGADVAFLTIGDPTIYSTFFYIHDRLTEHAPDLKINFIPGISSINASAAAAGISLGLADESIAILPATYVDNIRETLRRFDTVVLMKVHRVVESVVRVLEEMNLLERAICVSRIGMDDEKIFTDLKSLKAEDIDYFSTIIVKR